MGQKQQGTVARQWGRSNREEIPTGCQKIGNGVGNSGWMRRHRWLVFAEVESDSAVPSKTTIQIFSPLIHSQRAVCAYRLSRPFAGESVEAVA
jgi:hypothetical protein